MTTEKPKAQRMTKKRIEKVFLIIGDMIKKEDVAIYSSEIKGELLITGVNGEKDRAFDTKEVETGETYRISFDKLVPFLKKKDFEIRKYKLGSMNIKINSNKDKT